MTKKAKAAHAFERAPHEWYVEPSWPTMKLLRASVVDVILHPI